MRVVHAVTLITPDGAFGGPVRVAVNQASALIDRGHDVQIIAGSWGYTGSLPTSLGGVPVRLFPTRRLLPGAGFSGLVAPGLATWARRGLTDVDLLHIHAARDLITLTLGGYALKTKTPYVLQPHGMIDPSSKALSRPLDALITRRVLRGASAVFYLTPQERADLQEVARDPLPYLVSLGNGVPKSWVDRSPQEPPDVLFMARLQTRKRPAAFVAMAAQLLQEGVDASFSLVGPDEGEGPTVRAAIDRLGSKRIRWEGPLAPEATLARLSQATLYVLPSINEPYPMAVLEALSVGCPVVVTESCGLAPAIQELGCGLVVNEAESGLISGVRALLADPTRLGAMSEAALRAAAERFGMGPVIDRLESAYSSAS